MAVLAAGGAESKCASTGDGRDAPSPLGQTIHGASRRRRVHNLHVNGISHDVDGERIHLHQKFVGGGIEDLEDSPFANIDYVASGNGFDAGGVSDLRRNYYRGVNGVVNRQAAAYLAANNADAGTTLRSDEQLPIRPHCHAVVVAVGNTDGIGVYHLHRAHVDEVERAAGWGACGASTARGVRRSAGNIKHAAIEYPVSCAAQGNCRPRGRTAYIERRDPSGNASLAFRSTVENVGSGAVGENAPHRAIKATDSSHRLPGIVVGADQASSNHGHVI